MKITALTSDPQTQERWILSYFSIFLVSSRKEESFYIDRIPL